MPLLSPHFPAGRSGAGLLLLRLSAALAILAAPGIAAAEAPRWICTAFAAFLILGLWTRVAAILCIGVVSLELMQGADPVGSSAQFFEAAAILLLGAGAYSMDAGIFGRRTIILQRGRD
ncbi:hypothetical protein [Sphingomonas trueperi]|uniref:hypothetical protein n=1 Tax=Sphingomonas trueperi TaxID=53317 RepID=UPI000EB0E5C9